MKTIYSFLTATIFFLLVSLTISSEPQKTKPLNLYPVCNHEYPMTNPAPEYTFRCVQGDIVIDSQCCMNLWNYYGTNPPLNLQCTIIDIRCPEDMP